MAQATVVVPPMHQVLLFGQGYDAVQISARKVTLMKQGQKSLSVSYNKFDAVEQMPFADLVSFVINKNKVQ
jgi:maltodextrin utilization protein YvdJ